MASCVAVMNCDDFQDNDELLTSMQNDSQRGNLLMKHLHTCWKENLYCDITLRVEGKSIGAHKVVLSTASDYFKALISMDVDTKQGFQSPNDGAEIELHNLDYDSVCSILEYVYTGHIKISQDNVTAILITSDFLQVQFVKRACIDFILQDVNQENCIQLVKFASQFSLQQIFYKASTVLGKHLETLSEKGEFLELPFDVIYNIADDDDLVIFQNGIPLQQSERELALLRGVMKYIEGRSYDKDIAEKLVKAVRLPLINKKMLEKEISLHVVFKASSELGEILRLVKKITSSKNPPKHLIPKKWLEPRRRFLNQFIDQNTEWHVFATGEQTGRPSKWFDDGKAIELVKRLTGIAVLIRLWDGRRVVGGLEISYSDNKVIKHGMKRGGVDGCIDIQEFTLDSDEIITKVGVRAGWMIDQLIFHTSKGNVYGPYGGNGGTYTLVAPRWNDNSITFLHGFAGGEIRTQQEIGITFLKLIWRCIDSDTSKTINMKKEFGKKHGFSF